MDHLSIPPHFPDPTSIHYRYMYNETVHAVDDRQRETYH
eukprot:COSAG03_NODE_26264_length_260_cov_0.645963_1_plen_38_part_01